MRATWEICFNQSEALSRPGTPHQYGISGLVFSDVIRRGNRWWQREMSAVLLTREDPGDEIGLVQRRYKDYYKD